MERYAIIVGESNLAALIRHCLYPLLCTVLPEQLKIDFAPENAVATVVFQRNCIAVAGELFQIQTHRLAATGRAGRS